MTVPPPPLIPDCSKAATVEVAVARKFGSDPIGKPAAVEGADSTYAPAEVALPVTSGLLAAPVLFGLAAAVGAEAEVEVVGVLPPVALLLLLPDPCTAR